MSKRDFLRGRFLRTDGPNGPEGELIVRLGVECRSHRTVGITSTRAPLPARMMHGRPADEVARTSRCSFRSVRAPRRQPPAEPRGGRAGEVTDSGQRGSEACRRYAAKPLSSC